MPSALARAGSAIASAYGQPVSAPSASSVRPDRTRPSTCAAGRAGGFDRLRSVRAQAVSQRLGFSTNTVWKVSSSIAPCSRSAGTTSSKTSVIDQLRIAPWLFEHLRGLRREPVDRGAEVLGDHQALGVPAAQQLGGRRVALVDRQVHLEAVAVEAHVDALVDQPLDVVDVVGVAAVGDLHARQIDALLLEDLDLARARPDRRHRVGHDRGARLHARARDRAVDLLDVLGHAGGVGGALQEGRPDVGALASRSMS